VNLELRQYWFVLLFPKKLALALSSRGDQPALRLQRATFDFLRFDAVHIPPVLLLDYG
jgi:hypothetical protein